MIKKYFLFAVTLLVLSTAVVNQTSAQSVYYEVDRQLDATAGPMGANYAPPTDPRYTAALIIRSAFGLLGIVIFVFYLYAGYLWLTAAGNDEQVGKAKNVIRDTTIGLIVLFAAYSIAVAVIRIAAGEPITAGGWSLRI